MKEKLLVFSLFLIFVIAPGVLSGQSKITGTVTGESGPLPGATINIKGTPSGTVTDVDGKYSIEAAPDDTLLFRFMGYKRKLIPVGDKKVINVQLVLKKEMLDEVVVVGYGSMKKSDLTGATSTVRVDDNVARSYNNVDNMLMGRSSGVTVVSNNGNPGEAASVRIRGSNSLRGNNEPLYVVDGIVITSAGEDVALGSADGNESQQAINGLAGINPADIESIEVLKDASATAIYGSRGSNGVILITTKQGAKGKAKIDAYAITGVSYINKKLPVLNGADYARYRNEAGLLNGTDPDYYIDGNEQVYPLSYDTLGNPVPGSNPFKQVNWQDEIYQAGISYNVGASVSGGTKKGTYYISANYNNVGGIVENSSINSGNLRLNLTQHLTDKLTIDARVSLYSAKNNFAQSGSKAGGNRSFTKSVLTFSPLIGDDVEDFQNDLGVSNPLSWIHDFEDVTRDFRTLGSLKLTYKLPVKGLRFQVHGANDVLFRERRRWYGITTFPGQQNNGRLTISGMNRVGYTIDNLLLYNRTFNKKHSINATVGYVFDHKGREDNIYEVVDFVTYDFTIDGARYGQVATVPYKTFPQEENMSSIIGRLNYSYSQKYSLTATFRADGSSKFKKENRFSYFPSFSFAWRISEEDFMENINVINNLKLRAGWGLTGNQAINPYQTFANYNVGYYSNPDNSTGLVFYPDLIPNPDLRWETTSQYNVGIDYGLYDSRIYGSIDFYYKETYDLLQQIALPPSTGFKSMLVNRGSISNKGIDLSLTGVAISTKNTTLSLGGIFSLNRNKVLDLGIPVSPIYIDGELVEESYYLGDNISTGQYFKCPANVFVVGQPVGMFYGWETDGIYQTGDPDILQGSQPGDVRIVDQNGDGKIDINDRVIIGDPNPDFTYSFNVDFSWKRFSLTMLAYGVYGNDIANGTLLRYGYANGDAQNINPDVYENAWRPGSPSDEYPRIGYSEEKFAAITDRIIEDGSYFRLNNITLGYDVPIGKKNKKKINKVHVYVTGQNLFTITGYSGYDPNITSFQYNGNIQGVDWNPYPNTRMYLLGLNVTF
jgi:TonB-linked SusC/RagA family outer membrane protein